MNVEAEGHRRLEASTSETVTGLLAGIVIALATGMPLRSAGKLIPSDDDHSTPYLGV
ncbi:hypothetical protein [Methylobacterium brachythecii]|uniref:Uncharacterized protein n=1 Tax=Methylobacterium brachythecii TaxID=1176177 RepID=A0A7W6F9C3_9HYPH|nr:hypothetical protein [Methylobacterium brachythecii]MBB3905001.1 hypothetical protein [Methylobacterium brachythecii]GLS45785.1 hypothetical protein GCM10007884_37760 [Methylobacterium brachythecii]